MQQRAFRLSVVHCIAALTANLSFVESFQGANLGPKTDRIPILCSPCRLRSSRANECAEDEKDKHKNATDGDDWTETEDGAFVPNIFRRVRRRPKHGRDVVKRITAIPDYKAQVIDERERITVVRFYAPWCKSCRASEPLFYRLAADYAPRNVNFVEVSVTKGNAILHEALGIPSLPWVHIYHPEAGLTEERKVSNKYFEDVRKTLRCYVDGICDMEDMEAFADSQAGKFQ
uniref:Thioredoxin domain-containing protein n=1 Tax=Odontella aurita TaxID=265563 RepID=A0A7S4JLC6_9STRA|mmetsp:Transcript_48596/g.146558  ORF Transcript_48596/g.146558 Transcript_48596/m.146558 type:complete len:231 (+) Transcript_48596:65-757(+)